MSTAGMSPKVSSFRFVSTTSSIEAAADFDLAALSKSGFTGRPLRPKPPNAARFNWVVGFAGLVVAGAVGKDQVMKSHSKKRKWFR